MDSRQGLVRFILYQPLRCIDPYRVDVNNLDHLQDIVWLLALPVMNQSICDRECSVLQFRGRCTFIPDLSILKGK